jgi:hypothetical protein
MLALAVSVIVTACSTAETTVTSPELASVSFSKQQNRQENRCGKYKVVYFVEDDDRDDRVDFQQALQHAYQNGWAVASISSQEEQNCINKLADDPASKVPENDWKEAWIGATDRWTEGEWRWEGLKNSGIFYKGVYPGTSYGYTNWYKAGGPIAYTNQPDNDTDFGSRPEGQDCAVVLLARGTEAGANGQWDDVGCRGRKNRYVAKMK